MPTWQVDPELAPLDHFDAVASGVRCSGASEQGTNAAAELPDRERLRDVVVGTELEPENLVQLLTSCGEHDDRDTALAAQPLADFEPVQPWEHHVQDDEIDVLVVETAQRVLAVTRLDDAVPVALEREREQRLD